jgi:hypothetical protein
MSTDFSKLRHEQQSESEGEGASKENQTEQNAKEFATVDDLLRFDSEQNPAPPEIAERLNRSIGAEPKPSRSWFKRIFGS